MDGAYKVEGSQLTSLTDEEFKKELDSGRLDEGYTPVTLRKQFICSDVKTIDEKRRRIDFTISTDSVDRMGDTVSVDGWELKHFRKNPVVLFAHDSRQPPIAKALSVKKTDGKLVARAEFMDKELSPFAFSIFQMFQKGFMRATSVGFRPTKFKFSEDEKRKEDFWMPIDFEKQELLEFSAVPVPANPEALMDAKNFGIDLAPLNTWAHEVLDNWSTNEKGFILPRSLMEEFEVATSQTKPKHFRLTGPEQETLLEKNLKLQEEQKEVELEEVKEPMAMPEDAFGFDDEEKADDLLEEVIEPEAQALEDPDSSEHTQEEKQEEEEETLVIGLTAEAREEIVEETKKAVMQVLRHDEPEEILEPDEEEVNEFILEEFEKSLPGILDGLDQLHESMEAFKELASDRQGNRTIRNFVEGLEDLSKILKIEVLDLEPEPEVPVKEEKQEVKLPVVETPVAEKSSGVGGESVVKVTPDLVVEAVKAILPGMVKSVITENIDRMKGKVF
jgi:HK97 family phage prohead protease